MKVRKIIKKMYAAIARKDIAAEKKYWLLAMKKSLKHKKTHCIQ